MTTSRRGRRDRHAEAAAPGQADGEVALAVGEARASRSRRSAGRSPTGGRLGPRIAPRRRDRRLHDRRDRRVAGAEHASAKGVAVVHVHDQLLRRRVAADRRGGAPPVARRLGPGEDLVLTGHGDGEVEGARRRRSCPRRRALGPVVFGASMASRVLRTSSAGAVAPHVEGSLSSCSGPVRRAVTRTPSTAFPLPSITRPRRWTSIGWTARDGRGRLAPGEPRRVDRGVRAGGLVLAVRRRSRRGGAPAEGEPEARARTGHEEEPGNPDRRSRHEGPSPARPHRPAWTRRTGKAYTVVPPQDEPDPAVHPKQWRAVSTLRRARASGSKSRM